MKTGDFLSVKRIIGKAIKQGIFSGAALAAGRAENPQQTLRIYMGKRTFAPWSGAISNNSVFDLASLTKPLITALACMIIEEKTGHFLEEALPSFFEHVPDDKAGITVRLLLCHASGFSAHEKFYDMPAFYLPEKEIERIDAVSDLILSMPLAESPGTKAVYSDLGYILLGHIIKKMTGREPYEFVQQKIFMPQNIQGLFWKGYPAFPRDLVVPSGFCRFRKRMLAGEVNDANAWFLGGRAGHAGLFGTLEAVEALISSFLQGYLHGSSGLPVSMETLTKFFQPARIPPDSTWALGFDTPSKTGSTAGRFFSSNSVGHLGYTGTSFWIDLQEGVYIIFLSNRTFPFDTRASQSQMKAFRQKLHDNVRRIMLV